MMRNEEFLLLVAESTHFIIKLEKLLQKFKICCRIVPLPGELSAGCGLSIKATVEDREKIEKILADEKLEIEKYIVQSKNFSKTFERLS